MQKQPIQDINNIMTSFYLALPSVMLLFLATLSRPCNTFNGRYHRSTCDIWAIMLFVAVVYMLCSALRQFHSATTEYTYKVHHNSFIEIV
jgi:hypothetical protein